VIPYLHDLFQRRDLIAYLITSGLKAQHRNSALGYLWWLLDPLFGLLVYSFIVERIFGRGGENYWAFLAVGLIVWRWLAATTTAATSSIVRQSAVITQVQVPKIVFPITETFTGLFHFVFGLVIVATALLAWGLTPGWSLIWLPWIVFVQLLFTLALSTALAYFGVFLRDLDAMMSHALRFWFFASPVIWRPEMMPESVRWLLVLNPMTYVLAAYRSVLVTHEPVGHGPLAVMALSSLVVVAGLVGVYSRHEHRIIRAL
jgi:lipopolysaccharide transport system permease protein/teichoic acid transport system permease protein